jgi:eukaryotic-like serine/threonine-protein kinase
MHGVIGSTIPGAGGGSGSEGSPRPGDLIADRYQIERFIGRGGMAEVFAGLNVRTGKRVALKWIRPALAATAEALARFRREAVAAGRIHHPNVVTVFDVVEHKSATWLVMELLEGDTLSEILSRVERMDAEEAVMLLIPAMRGVAAAHAHGVVHRDIKPDNIFICRAADGHRREAKVLDFGVSKLSDEAGDQVSITVTGNLVGTPTYMAPEQVRGNKVVDPRSDVYSLGVVLYQMLAGRPPFQGQIYSALMIEIATTDPPALRSLRPDLSEELEAVVHKAMARDLPRRYPDVTSFVHALEGLMGIDPDAVASRMQALHSERIDLPPMTPSGREETQTLELTRQRVRRTRLAVIMVGAVILAGIGIRVLTAPRSTRALKALEERSRVAETPGSTSGSFTTGPMDSPARAAAPAGVGRAIGGFPVAGALGADGHPLPAVGAPGSAAAVAGKGRGHARLATSKIDKPVGTPGSPDQTSDGAREAAREAAKPPLPPTPYVAPQPATRAGRLYIDDF